MWMNEFDQQKNRDTNPSVSVAAPRFLFFLEAVDRNLKTEEATILECWVPRYAAEPVVTWYLYGDPDHAILVTETKLVPN